MNKNHRTVFSKFVFKKFSVSAGKFLPLFLPSDKYRSYPAPTWGIGSKKSKFLLNWYVNY